MNFERAQGKEVTEALLMSATEKDIKVIFTTTMIWLWAPFKRSRPRAKLRAKTSSSFPSTPFAMPSKPWLTEN